MHIIVKLIVSSIVFNSFNDVDPLHHPLASPPVKNEICQSIILKIKSDGLLLKNQNYETRYKSQNIANGICLMTLHHEICLALLVHYYSAQIVLVKLLA